MSANQALVEAHYAASDAGDLAGMLAPFSPDIEWTEAAGFPYAGTYVGPDAVAAGVFGRIQAEFSPFVVTIDAVYDGGVDDSGLGTVFGVGNYSGTYTATGRSFDARVVHVWRVRDGQAVAFEQIVDSAEVRAATD
ncbi:MULTISPECIES: nuclear transport factor 2 family protein [unclassified Leucobacter]|uniref:nuclear transport factor 2 family protein n=1 Tax=unclassified Leucobacter TaxID=2621730 RepID=UPI00165D9ABB|nr:MULTISPECIES: nuclear transport factor 2 family protein [unclassified Leucobacter]MBC9937197.1 nuclear transport factor 2 family protein [Leucobacter sp. cx-87]